MKEIAHFYEPEEARIAVGFLKSHGLAVELADAETLNTMPEMRIGLGGYRIFAEDQDALAAKHLLAEVASDHAETQICQNCQSPRIAKMRDLRFPLIHAFLVGLFPFARPTGELRCRDCDHRWFPEDAEKDANDHEPD